MKKHTLRIIIICAVIVTVLIVCASVMLFSMFDRHPEVDGIKVTDSGCDVFGVSAEIVSAILDDEDPLLEIEWTNRTPKEYYISTHHTVYIERNGTFEKTEISEPSYSGKWALHPFKTYNEEYSLVYAELRTGAKYRIEVKLSDKDGKKEGKAWIEFEISEKISMEYFYATVIERVCAVDNNGNNKDYLIVEPFDWEPESKASDKIIVNFDTAYYSPIDYYELIGKGSMVGILYDGRIEETYPARLPNVYVIKRVLHLDRAEASCVSLKLYTSEERNKDSDSHDPMETLSNNECWRNTVNAKDEIIEILKSVEYEKTDHIFGESEVLSVEFMNSTVWYAAEYKTKDVYAIHDGAFYKVKDPEKLIKALGPYILTDGHSIINQDFYSFDDVTVLENGSKVYPTQKFRKERFFYNESLRDPCLVIPRSSKPCSGEVVDGFTVSKNVADFLHVEVYSTYVFYDDITDTWLVEISDEAHYQKLKEEAEADGGELCYDRYCKVITDGKGKILYYFDYFLDDEDSDTGSANHEEPALPLELTKDSIPNTKDWKTKGLESAGLYGVEISEPYSASFGKLYVLSRKTEKTPLWEIYFAVENGSDIMLNQLPSGALADIKICNVDGKAGDEIIFVAFNGGCGGAGGYDTYVFNVDKGSLNRIFYASRATSRESGFESKLIAPFSIEITNKYTGYRYVESLEEGHWIRNYFDANGDPTFEGGAELDNISQIITDDVDGDGDYELICKQYTYFGSTAGFIGYSISTWNYDEALGEFIVIDAEYDPETNIDVEVLPH